MKTLILLIAVFFWAYISNAQNVNIPDTEFLYALIEEGVDINGDNLISYNEAEAVTLLDVGVMGFCSAGGVCGVTPGNISDLTGIEAFINLNSLKIHRNKIDSIDLSMNNDLCYLDCHSNNLTSLDLSKNTALTHLSCGNNQLTSLDISNNITLQTLDCKSNQLTSLDVTNNTALTTLRCDANQLTNLDVSNNLVLEFLNCHDNQLTGLDVSNNLALNHLSCSRNLLNSLDISNNTALDWLWCFDNQLTSLDVSNNIALTGLDCSSNQLTSLDISNNTALQTLDCKSNQLTSLDVSNNTFLEDLYLSDMPTLYEVCVWTMPFPPAGVYLGVDVTGSPNVCFETECNGLCENTEIEEYKKRVLTIYPNPTDDIINIEIENINNAKLEIYNVSGKLIFSKDLDSKVEKINISGFSKGIYVIKVIQDRDINFGKVVVR